MKKTAPLGRVTSRNSSKCSSTDPTGPQVEIVGRQNMLAPCLRARARVHERESMDESVRTIRLFLEFTFIHAQNHVRAHTQFGIFPSGDAAGAGGFGYTAMLFTGNPLWLLVTMAGCFGRVFLHAHHVLDVLVGACIGFIAAQLLDWCLCPSFVRTFATPAQSSHCPPFGLRLPCQRDPSYKIV